MVASSLHFCQKVFVSCLWVTIEGSDDPVGYTSVLQSQCFLCGVLNSDMMNLQTCLKYVALHHVERCNVLSAERSFCLKAKRLLISLESLEVPL